MAVGSSLTLGSIEGSGLRLVATAVAVPALASHIQPVILLGSDETYALLQALDQADTRRGGRFRTMPSGVQVWSAPPAVDPASGAPGEAAAEAVHLGSVDWLRDAPAQHHITLQRCMVTRAGQAAGETPAGILGHLLALIGLAAPADRVTAPVPPPRDPFRRGLANYPS